MPPDLEEYDYDYTDYGIEASSKVDKEHQDLNDPYLFASSAPEQPGSSESNQPASSVSKQSNS